MSDTIEVVVSAEATGQLWTACVWDPSAGTTLMTYKGGTAAPHTLCFAGKDYLLAADPNNPIIRSWALNHREQTQLRMVCPGKVTALTCTQDGHFCAAGTADKLNIWQISTGLLLCTVKGHYQPITCIKFTDDGSLLATGGEDAQVLVWDVASLIGKKSLNGGNTEQIKPKFTFSDHTNSIRDIVIGMGGVQTILASVSTDKYCKIYSLATGSMIFNIIFPVGLTCVALNNASTTLFVGTSNGKIYSHDLHTADKSEIHIRPNDPSVYIGHKACVVCLSVSLDGQLLLSGAHDDKVIIWNAKNHQELRQLPHKGAVTNAFFAIAPKNIFSPDLKATILMHSFERGSNNKDNIYVDKICKKSAKVCLKSNELLHALQQQTLGNVASCYGKSEDVQQNTANGIHHLEMINHELYTFAVNELLTPSKQSSSTQEDEAPCHATKKQKRVV